MSPGAIRRRFRVAFDAALLAVDPEESTRAALARTEITPPVTLLAIGKAAAGMARGAVRELGGAVASGVVVMPAENSAPPRLRALIGDHPLPGPGSLMAGRALLQAAAGAEEGTLLVLVSGGGSALAEVPLPGLSLSDLTATQQALLEAGAPIEDVNTVRRHLSRIKDGGLLREAGVPAVTLLISDVADAPPSAIASGPTLADATSPSDGLDVLRSYGLADTVPPAVPAALARARAPSPAGSHRWEVVADGARAADAAAAHLAGAGLEVRLVTTSLRGPAERAASELLRRAGPGTVDIAAGETTVTVTGGGLGGRNQHAALAAAIRIDGRRAVFAALGTDGRDGPTDAAGAIVDGSSAARMRAAGVNPSEYLRRCDSYRALMASGDLVVTGPTGTNVADLWFVLAGV